MHPGTQGARYPCALDAPNVKATDDLKPCYWLVGKGLPMACRLDKRWSSSRYGLYSSQLNLPNGDTFPRKHVNDYFQHSPFPAQRWEWEWAQQCSPHRSKMWVQVLKGMNLSDCCYYIDWHEVQALCPVISPMEETSVKSREGTWRGAEQCLTCKAPSPAQKVIPKPDHEPNQIKPKHSFYLRGECRVWKLK